MSWISAIFIYGLPILIAVTLHELAHGMVAFFRGDDTAKKQGRLSPNPMRHIDSFGTILLPAILIFLKAPFIFGYAKPVPVNVKRLYHPRFDMILVALAGPMMNFFLAFVSVFLMLFLKKVPHEWGPFLFNLLHYSVLINVVLGVFNLLPLPPLDGSRVVLSLLPDSWGVPLERLGMLLLGMLLLTPFLLQTLGIRVPSLYTLLHGPVQSTMDFIVSLVIGRRES